MSPDKFHSGDIVRCIDDRGCSRVIKYGDIGTVDRPAYVNDGPNRYLHVVNKDGEMYGWRENRFELVETGLEMPDTRDYLNVLSDYPAD